MMYHVYVGHYESPAISKSDVTKLSRYGITGYVFSRGDYYSLKVFSSPNKDKVNEVKILLEQKGFVVEIETIDIKKNLHV